ncbi:MAG: DNA gyrase/topoisomerase IV subunit A, partial [Phaeodactylibacter sp.]|nr:DNA gyrase/topoisomerase IV subunit A [Phaeodactylibacter sp.]
AVGLSTKILPHNFVELIKASIKVLQGKKVKIYPDFQTGGMIDVSDYNGGKRGGRVKVRAMIDRVDKSILAIRELPFGVTTPSLIESIIKASDKGKIKIKKVVDNTAQEVEVLVELAPGTSPDLTVDALYAFTQCEVPISPNACVIIDDKPHFLTVEEILDISTEHTKDLLRQELEIRKGELLEKLHFASLEKIFIEKRIYRDIEECETWEAVLEAVDAGLRKYVVTPANKPQKGDKRLRLLRDITEEDLTRLTEIKIKRISKYNSFKADELIARLEEELKEVQHHLDNLVDYAIAYFEDLLAKHGKGRERRTRITTFDTIQATEVVANNAKLYVNRKEGFIGTGLKKDEFVCDCSDIDDIIVFRQDGVFLVSRIADKVFVGKDIIHVDVWKKGDDRTTYNMIYTDGKSGRSFAKRFNVKAITRDREYDLTSGEKGSKVLYFSANPNGEAEVVTVQLTQGSRARIKLFDYDFGDLDIKGRSSKGNTLTRYPVRKVALKEVGKSTLGALQVWMDEVSGRLNTDERGKFLGAFDTGDTILAIYKDGTYEVMEMDLNKRFDPGEIMHIGKFDPNRPINTLYFEGERGWTMAKRFLIETTTTGQRFPFLTEDRKTKLLYASLDDAPKVQYSMKVNSKKVEGEIDLASFVDVKGWKAIGNKVSDQRLTGIREVNGGQEATPPKPEKEKEKADKENPAQDKLKAGDSIEFDIEKNGQGKLF